MDVEEAIRHAIDGKAVLFTGAGFSFGAKNVGDQPIPSGKALATKLLSEVGYKDRDSPLDKAAAAYLRRKEKHDLVKLLLQDFAVRRVTTSHESIASLSWRRIYTTNYDLVYEEGSKQGGVLCNVIDSEDSPRDNISKENLVIHINGVITRLTEDRLDSSFKLISQSYAADSFEKSGWAFYFRNDIRSAAAVIFVGYSMYDLDVRRIIFSEDISDKCVFVVAPTTPETELDAEDLADLGVVAPIGVDAFASVIEEVKTDYSPQESELLLESWESVGPIKSAVAAPADSEILDFLLSGDVSDSLLLEATASQRGKYVVDRQLLPAVDADLVKTGARAVIVGELGVGKSFLCTCLLQIFGSRGWEVFRLEAASGEEISEAEEICDVAGNKLLFVESYHRHMDLIRWLSETKPEGVSVLLTERTHIHDLFAKELYELVGDKLRVFDASRFVQSEVSSSVALFDRYGLWGDRTIWSPEKKSRFVVNNCKNRLPFLLLDVLKSTHITERYKQLLVSVGNRGDVERVLICVFALDVMGFSPRVSVIEELLANGVRWAMLRSQADLKPIIDFGAKTVNAKSAVLGIHLLHHLFSAKSVVATLIGMAKEADLRRSSREFVQISNNLMRYRNVGSILPESNRLESTINFYEGIKNLLSAKRNPQFWLQYAIACLDRAERYFKDAYSLVSSDSSYDTFMIDNHYARLLLEKALVASSHVDAILLTEDAKKIIFRQMNVEIHRYYPYRVALRLFPCYEQFLTQWNPGQKGYFKKIFEELKRRCEATSGELKKNRYVVDCLSRAGAALESTK